MLCMRSVARTDWLFCETAPSGIGLWDNQNKSGQGTSSLFLAHTNANMVEIPAYPNLLMALQILLQ